MINFPTCSQQDIEAVKAMKSFDREKLKSEINAYDPRNVFTEAKSSADANKRFIICPYCGNGSGKSKTPVDISFEDGAWLYHCFSCDDLKGTLLKIIAHDSNLNLDITDDYHQALAIGARVIGYTLPEVTVTEEYLKLVREDIKDAQKQIENLPQNQRRGLSMHTLNHFGFGYLPAWVPPTTRLKHKLGRPTRRIIIPTPNHYNAVALPADRKPSEKKYWKMHAAPMELFNQFALAGGADWVLVLEGEIDAASIWQSFIGTRKDVEVVATCGVGNWTKTLLPKLKGVKDKKFLVLFDAEYRSRIQAKDLCGELIKRGHPAAYRFFYDALNKKQDAGEDLPFRFDEKIDANKILQESSEWFLRTLTESIVDDVQEEIVAAQKTAEAMRLAAQLAEEETKRIAAWEKVNGKIDPQVMSELLEASNFLKSFAPLHVTAQDINSSTTKRAIALCKFYDAFSQAADRFYNTVDAAKAYAKSAVNLAKNEGDGFVNAAALNEYEFADCNALINLSLSELNEDVARLVKEERKNHKAYRERERQRISREHDEKRQAEKEKRMAQKQSRMEELLAENPSPERDAEIIELIRESCEWRFDNRHTPVEVKATGANADKIFTNDPNLDGLFGYDEFRQAPVFLKSSPWNSNSKFGDEWSDDDDAQLRNYLRRVYTEFNGRHLVDDKFVEYSRKHSFHEVKEFFYNLPEWDGTPRAETLFVKFLKADDTPYVREVTLNWLTASVARIFYPGCEYQIAPILLGEQGIGKTHLISRLGGNWYGSLMDDMGDSHAVDTIQSLWLVEVKEMAAMKKDVDAQKSFIDTAEDTRRIAYGRRATKTKRHCTFIITTNNQLCLTDLTGNRRYPVIPCRAKPRQYVSGLTDEYIQQVWAEVYRHYLELAEDIVALKDWAEKLELSKESQRASDRIAEDFTRNDLGEVIQTFLDTKILPGIIWTQLEREERREFIAKGKLVILNAESELCYRVRSRHGRKAQSVIDKLLDAMNLLHKNQCIRKHTINRGNDTDTEFHIYGSEYRQHISPQEIYTEAFDKTDRRKSLPNIVAALNKIEGWTLGRPLRTDHKYKNQRTVFYRDEDNNPGDDE